MRKICFSLYILFVGILISCNDSPDVDAFANLKGKWNLVKITGELSSQDLPEGMITYNFNTQLHKVTIQNNTELTYPVSGTYSYVLNEQSALNMCQSTINVNNEGTYCFSLEGNSMTFDLSAVDGLKLDFSK